MSITIIIISVIAISVILGCTHYAYRKGLEKGIHTGRCQILEENIIRAKHTTLDHELKILPDCFK